MVIQVYALTTNVEKDEDEWFCRTIYTRLSKTNTKKDIIFIIGD